MSLDSSTLKHSLLESSTYSSRARNLLRLVNTLRDAGAHMDLDLPTVVVCGNQSAGKSSLLEGLCGITLPRGEGTCTRSVTEVRLSDSISKEPWRCSIKLRFEFDSQGRPLGKPKEIPFGPDFEDQKLLELWVRRAQKVLLNPSQDPSKFMEYTLENTAAAIQKDAKSNELKFTRNVVCLDIKNAGVNLTLIDLPGIIRSVDHREDSQYIDLIQETVKAYIRKDRAIVVATITCKDEIENQAIVNWAKEVDPYGTRTIGVLTKPDTIEPATHDKWVSILLGDHYHLKLGYWMVKNPSKADLDSHISFSQARAHEQEFFNSTNPWCNLSSHLDRFGTDNLRRELSRQLTILSDAALPDLKSKTEEAMQQTATQLAKLPPQISENPRIELLQMIRQFCSVIGYNVAAQQEYKAFYQKVRCHFETFKESIVNTRPVFVFDKKIHNVSLTSPSSAPSLIPSLPNLIPNFLTGNDDRRNSAKNLAKVAEPKEGVKYSLQGMTLTESDTLLDVKKPISMSDIRKVIDSQKGRELQGYSPYAAFEFIVASFQEDWSKHAIQLLSSVSNELHLLIAKLTDDSFGRFVNLQGQLRFTIQVYQSELYRTTLETLGHLVQMERRSPFTMGSDEFVKLKSSALTDFKALFEVSRGGTPQTPQLPLNHHNQHPRQETVNRALAALAEAGYTGLSGRDLLRLKDSGTSESEETLQVMASTDAYFTMCSKRYIDNVPMTVEYHFLAKFAASVEKEVVGRLGILDKDNDRLKYLIQEDGGVRERREKLEERRERLEKVWRSLHEFGN